MQGKRKKVLISDFDGTISKKDFFWYAVNELLKPEDITPWNDYLEKKITHIEALSKIFSKIKLNEKEFKEFVLTLPIEECFVETANYCSKNNIGFYIISAGADLYIKIILEHLKVSNLVTLISNKSSYTFQKGLFIHIPDKNNKFYSYNYGVDKRHAVKSIIKDYNYSIFAGDGRPDFDAAKETDKIFARETLLDLCRKNNIEATEFKNYCEILEYLKND